MKVLLAGFLLALTASPAVAETCFDLGKGFPAFMSGRAWNGFQLRRGSEVAYIMLLEKPKTKGSEAAWFLATAVPEKIGLFCVEAAGKEINVLASPHDFASEERFGLPGSGHPRCSKASDALGGLKVRVWASKELGDSLIFSLDASNGPNFVLLMARLDAQWILLEGTPSQGTCYRDRGQLFDVRAIELSSQKP